MRTITKTIDLYKYDELNQVAKDRAMADLIDAEIEMMDENSPFYPACEEAERLRVPWFLGSIIWEKYESTLVDILRHVSAEYLEDGEFYGFNEEVI